MRSKDAVWSQLRRRKDSFAVTKVHNTAERNAWYEGGIEELEWVLGLR
jgi:hypothetical protein